MFESKNQKFITKLIEVMNKNKEKFRNIDSPDRFSKFNIFIKNEIKKIESLDIIDGDLHYSLHMNELLKEELYEPVLFPAIYFPKNKIIVSMKFKDTFIKKKEDTIIFAICYDITSDVLKYYSNNYLKTDIYFSEIKNGKLDPIIAIKNVSAERIIADIIALPNMKTNESSSNTIRRAIGENLFYLLDKDLLRIVLSQDDDPFSGHCIWGTEIVENYYLMLELFSNLALSYYTPNPEKIDYFMQGFFEFHKDYVISAFWPNLSTKAESNEYTEFGIVMNRNTKEMRFFAERKSIFLSQTSFLIDEYYEDGTKYCWLKEDIEQVYDSNKDPIEIFARNIWFLLENEETLKRSAKQNLMFYVNGIKIK